MNCILENTSVLPSSNFVDFIHRASRICLGQIAKALVWRWRQISPLKINIFTLSAPISTNEVSMFKLAIEVCFENHFGLIHAICLSLGSTKSGYFFLGHPVLLQLIPTVLSLNSIKGQKKIIFVCFFRKKHDFVDCSKKNYSAQDKVQ